MALRIALLGCGPLGVEYAERVAATDSTVVVVHDADQDHAAAVGQQTGARIAPSINDAVTAVGVDAIIVCLGGAERIQAITAAAAARRPVFDAVPPSVDAVSALTAAQEAGVVVGVDLRRRHDAGVREVIDAVRNGEVGDVRSCSIVSRDPILAFAASAIHDLDLARHLVGSDIVTVFGTRAQDITILLLTHENGVITSIENSQHAPAGTEHRVELIGTVGTVSSASRSRSGARVTTLEGERRWRQPDESVARSLSAQWVSFVEGVRSGEPSAGAADIAADIAAAHLAARAVAMTLGEGRAVRVTELLSAP